MTQFIKGCHDCGEWPVSDDHRCPATAGPVPNWVQQLAEATNTIQERDTTIVLLKEENDRLIHAKREVHQKLIRVQQELSDLKKEKAALQDR